MRGVRRPGGPDLCRVEARCALPRVPQRGAGGSRARGGDDGAAAPARPNVLMFGDGGFDDARIEAQCARYEAWLESLARTRDTRLVVVEVGAGTAVPTVRRSCEGLVASHRGPATLVRINLEQSTTPASRGDKRYVGIGGMGALQAIRALDALVRERRGG